MKLYSVQMPLTEFNHVEKGEALYGKFVLRSTCDHIFSILDHLGCVDSQQWNYHWPWRS